MEKELLEILERMPPAERLETIQAILRAAVTAYGSVFSRDELPREISAAEGSEACRLN